MTALPDIWAPAGDGSAPVVPEATQQDWPGAFVTTDPGDVASWTWTAPDGTDRSGDLTFGNGDTLDYPICGVHTIKGLDATGNVLATHEVQVGDPTAYIPGAIRVPDFTTLTLSDPSSQVVARTANSITLVAASPGATPSHWAYLRTALAIPAGKRVRMWAIERTATPWAVKQTLIGGFLSADSQNPATAAVHFGATVYRYNVPNYGQSGRFFGGASFGQTSFSADRVVAQEDVISSPDGTIENLFVTQQALDGTQSGNNTEVDYAQDLGDVVEAGVCIGRQVTGVETTITFEVLLQVR